MPRTRYRRRAATLLLTSLATLLFAVPITHAHAAQPSTGLASAAGASATTPPDAPAGTGSEDDGGGAGIWVAAGAGIVIAAGAAVVLYRRSRDAD